MKMATFLLLVVADAFASLKAFGRVLAITAAACCAAAASTDLPLLHPIFDSHMVFPRDVKAPVWGWARPGESVTLTVKDPTSLVTDETGSSGPWLVNNPVNAARPSRYTAVGYFFGRQLHRALHVPIGIVQMSWGGTSIEAWIEPATLSQDPNFPNAANLPPNAGANTGGAIFNGKVATILLFKAWRQGFQQPALPFIVIQLPNYKNDNWPILRDAQLNAVRNDPRSRLVVTIDLADPKELHPGDKQNVGIRAARAALDVAYGQKLVASGPLPARAATKGNALRCEFTDVGAGLMVGKREIPPIQPGVPTAEVVGGTLTGFEIAGADGKYHPAKAVISGRTTVEVSSPEVTSPVSVRYAWAGAPSCNLYNRIVDARGKTADGLPASPFSIPTIPQP